MDNGVPSVSEVYERIIDKIGEEPLVNVERTIRVIAYGFALSESTVRRDYVKAAEQHIRKIRRLASMVGR